MAASPSRPNEWQFSAESLALCMASLAKIRARRLELCAQCRVFILALSTAFFEGMRESRRLLAFTWSASGTKIRATPPAEP